MKIISVIFSSMLISFFIQPKTGSITVTSFVKIKNNRQREALYYFENNWKVLRDIAVSKGFIKSYKLLLNQEDPATNFNLILMTEYADSSQYNLSEERFQKIIKETRPDGPLFLNELNRNDFIESDFTKKSTTLFSSE